MSKLKKGGVIAGALLLAGGVAIIVHVTNDSTEGTSPSVAAPASASYEVARAPTSTGHVERSPPPQGLQQTSTASANDRAIERYDKLAFCAKYGRHRAFVQELKADPDSWVNSEAARSQLSPDDLMAVEKTLKFVEQQAATCEPVPELSLSAMVEMYEAALAAANAGDLEAARCFVVAPWQSTLDDQGPAKPLRELYAANAQRVVDASLRAGDWTMVDSMVSMHLALHSDGGLPAVAFQTDPAKAYRYQQLIVLGATDSESAQANKRLDEIAARVPASQREAQLKWATEMHAKYFNGRPFKTTAPACDF